MTENPENYKSIRVFTYDCQNADCLNCHQIALIVAAGAKFDPVDDGGAVRKLIWDEYHSNVLTYPHDWTKSVSGGSGSANKVDVLLWRGEFCPPKGRE